MRILHEALKASGIKIGAIVDVSEEKAKAFAEEFSIEKWGTDSSILLDDEITTRPCMYTA